MVIRNRTISLDILANYLIYIIIFSHYNILTVILEPAYLRIMQQSKPVFKDHIVSIVAQVCNWLVIMLLFV